MGMNNAVFLEVIEWLDPAGTHIVQRVPADGSGEIKLGAQLTVRESQAAVMFYQGRALDAFGPGRHTLVTANIPLLTKLLAIPWGMTSPLRAEVYFVNTKVFTNLTWGTRDPVAFKDSRLGLVRLRAFGVFNIRVVQPILFINRMVGTQGLFTTSGVEEYLSSVIVSRFNDHLGENLDSLLDLPGRYDELSQGLSARLAADLAHFGIGLTHIYINSITPPPEVQQAMDDRSRLAVFEDLDKLVKMKAAMALEKAGGQEGGGAGAGFGMGMGLMMPAMFAEQLRPGGGGSQADAVQCPDCKRPVPGDARFCPVCGHQLVVFSQCPACGKNLPPGAKFCSRCGAPAGEKPRAVTCAKCGFENLPGAVFCNQCGERLQN